MLIPIEIMDCLSLIGLMLSSDEGGEGFDLNGAQCSITKIAGRHSCFEAATADFGFLMVHPGWYSGEHGSAVHILIVGDSLACLRWLPLDQADKRALIERLPLDESQRTLLTLSV
jgi:hypothetical protein